MKNPDKKNILKKSNEENNAVDQMTSRAIAWKSKFYEIFIFLKKIFSGRRWIRRTVLYSVAVILIFCIMLLDYAFSPIDVRDKTVVIDIPTGSSFMEATELLQKEGLITNRFFFYSLAAIKRASRNIRAGEYEINTLTNPITMINKLMHGDIKVYEVVIPEDLSFRDIAVILDKHKLINKEIFFELARDQEFLKSLNIEAESIEGYLFPDTYHFNRSMNTRRIMKKMVDTFWQKMTPSMIRRANQMGLSVHKLVTMASIIGKESGSALEKPSVAAVFYNRLKRGMPLQSDPTAVYDMDDFEGKIFRSHLKRNSPYNTYRIKGLPPGPIANPGLDSLKATLFPSSVDYLYFVSKKDGTHHFSSSLVEHNQAVNRYINLKDEQNQLLEYDIPVEEY